VGIDPRSRKKAGVICQSLEVAFLSREKQSSVRAIRTCRAISALIAEKRSTLNGERRRGHQIHPVTKWRQWFRRAIGQRFLGRANLGGSSSRKNGKSSAKMVRATYKRRSGSLHAPDIGPPSMPNKNWDGPRLAGPKGKRTVVDAFNRRAANAAASSSIVNRQR